MPQLVRNNAATTDSSWIRGGASPRSYRLSPGTMTIFHSKFQPR